MFVCSFVSLLNYHFVVLNRGITGYVRLKSASVLAHKRPPPKFGKVLNYHRRRRRRVIVVSVKYGCVVWRLSLAACGGQV